MSLLDQLQSLPFTGHSGSLGAIVASHNQFGPYFRARTVPTDPRSLGQLVVRLQMGNVAKQWGLQMPDVRQGWEVYAARLRNTRQSQRVRGLTGRHQYIRSNLPRRINGLPFVIHAPTDLPQPELHVIRVEALNTPARISVFFDNSDEWAGQAQSAMLVEASPRLTAAINFHKAPMRKAKPIMGSPGLPPVSPTNVGYPFGPGDHLDHITVYFRVTLADGRLSRKHWFRGEVPS